MCPEGALMVRAILRGAQAGLGRFWQPKTNQEESHVSDQDFFFDDDEKPAAKSGTKTPAKKSGSQSSSRQPSKSGSRSTATSVAATAQSVTMTMAILFAVIALLLGMAIGLFIGNTLNANNSAATSAGGASSVAAPGLTQDQINSGQLPAGHPSVTGMGAGTGSTAATPTK